MLCATLIALALTAGALADAALKVTITGAESFVGVENAVVTATVTNTGDETVRVLNDPSTVLGKLATDVFVISNEDGTRPGFKGVAVKYIPNLQDVTTLHPGQSVRVEHSLADVYDFSSSGPGVYTIGVAPFLRTVGGDHIQMTSARVVSHSASLTGDLVTTVPWEKRSSFNGCSTRRREILDAAAQDANLLVQNAVEYLVGPPAPPTRYTTWFGIETQTRLATVQAHFGALANFNFNNFTYDCTCTDSVVAATTNPSRPGFITVCPPYFNLSPTGGDSQAGVLIQQAVQWDVVAGASPLFAVGIPSCLQLARTNPDLAVENADSHEYFAENPPVDSDEIALVV